MATVDMPDSRAHLTELPVDPFTGLSVHFGMLLGVSDIELLAANPRGKLRLHNAWLHGSGVVWGYRVTFHAATRELNVDPGLALDEQGRELHLGTRMCLQLDEWYDRNRARLGDHDLLVDVTVHHRACLDRPVPALAGECATGPDTAYSRINETVHIDLEKPVETAPTTFLRLRRALGQVPGKPQPIPLTELIAFDSLDLAPSTKDPPVVVARIAVTVHNGRPEIADGAIDHSVRRVHLPTTLVTELLQPHAPAGPHLDTDDIQWPDDQHLTITSSQPLHEATLPSGVQAHRWDNATNNWAPLNVIPSFADGRLVLDLGEPIADGTTVRIVVSGSGPTPVTADVDGTPVPLAGDAIVTIGRN